MQGLAHRFRRAPASLICVSQLTIPVRGRPRSCWHPFQSPPPSFESPRTTSRKVICGCKSERSNFMSIRTCFPEALRCFGLPHVEEMWLNMSGPSFRHAAGPHGAALGSCGVPRAVRGHSPMPSTTQVIHRFQCSKESSRWLHDASETSKRLTRPSLTNTFSPIPDVSADVLAHVKTADPSFEILRF